MKNNILKNTIAIISGLFIVLVFSGLTDYLLTLAKFYPDTTDMSQFTYTMLFVSIIYRLIFQIIGCYITGILSTKPMLYSLVLGSIGTLIATIGTIANWNMTTDIGMHAFCIALIAFALPTAWIAGKLVLFFNKK